MEPNGSLSISSLISTLTALFQFWSPPQSFSLKPFLLCPHLAQWLLQHKPTALSLLHRGHWATGCCSSYSSHHTVPPPGDPPHPPRKPFPPFQVCLIPVLPHFLLCPAARMVWFQGQLRGPFWVMSKTPQDKALSLETLTASHHGPLSICHS